MQLDTVLTDMYNGKEVADWTCSDALELDYTELLIMGFVIFLLFSTCLILPSREQNMLTKS
jgi:hypothetical protein